MNSVVDVWLPAAIGLVLTGSITGYLARLVWLSRVSRNWPSTNGRLMTSEMRKHPYFLGNSRQLLHMRYEYVVDGKSYVGRRARFGDWLSTNPAHHGRITSRFRAGDIVSVRYDPRRPEISTLERRLSKQVWLFLFIGLFQMGAILGSLVGWWD